MKTRIIVLAGVIFFAVAPSLAVEIGKKYNFRFKDGQQLRNSIVLEETKSTYRVRLEYLTEEKILEKKDLKESPVLAHTLNAIPASGSSLASLEKIFIAFAEVSVGADKPENYQLSGTALGTLKVAGAKQIAKFEYELLLSGTPVDGDLSIRLANITDNVGAALATESVDYKLDITRPQVVAAPLQKSRVRALDEIILQFSEAVTGADKFRNYTLSGPGTLKIRSVEAVAGAQNLYKLSLKGRPGNGETRLTMKGIADQVGNVPESEQIVFIGDTIKPLFTVTPEPGVVLRELKTLEIKFSEPVVGAEKPENYSFVGSAGDLRVQEIRQTPEGVYQLILGGSLLSGKVYLKITNVTDAAGNELAKNSITYELDGVAPRVVASPQPDMPVAGLTKIELTFSKLINGADDPKNIALEGEGVGDLKIRSIRKLKGQRYLLLLSGAPRDGDLLLRMRGISDAVGNPLQNNTIQFLVDLTPPRFEASLAENSSLNTLASMDVQFSEAIVGAETPGNYTLSGSGANGLKIVAVKNLGDHRYQLAFSGDIGNGKVTLRLKNIFDRAGNFLANSTMAFRGDIVSPQLQRVSPEMNAAIRELKEVIIQFSEPVVGGENMENYKLSGIGVGSLSVTSVSAISTSQVRIVLTGKPAVGEVALQLDNITDIAGNPLKAAMLAYRADTAVPIFQTDIAAGKKIHKLESLTLQFSKAVVGANLVENYRLSGAGKGSLRVVSAKANSSGSYVLQFAGLPNDGEIELRVVNVTDLVGNPLASDNTSFLADVTPPRWNSTPNAGAQINSITEILVKFSEPVAGAQQPENYQLDGAGLGSLRVAGVEALADNVFKMQLSGKPGNGALAIKLQNITDIAGNAPATDRFAYMLDTIVPVFSVLPENGTLANAFTKIEIQFSEPVLGASALSNYALSGEGSGSLAIERVEEISARKYQLILKGVSATGSINLAIRNMTDFAGNQTADGLIVYRSDTLKPSVVVSPDTTVPRNQLTGMQLEFSKPVLGVQKLSNYALSGEGVGSLAVTKVTHLGDNKFQLVLSGAPQNGKVVFQITNIVDQAGNAAEIKPIRYEIDMRPAEFNARPKHNSTLAQLTEIQLQFSEPVEGATEIKNYELAGDSTETLRISDVKSDGNNSYVLHLAGEAQGGKVQLKIQNITDRAGNRLRSNHVEYLVEIPTESQPVGDLAR